MNRVFCGNSIVLCLRLKYVYNYNTRDVVKLFEKYSTIYFGVFIDFEGKLILLHIPSQGFHKLFTIHEC